MKSGNTIELLTSLHICMVGYRTMYLHGNIHCVFKKRKIYNYLMCGHMHLLIWF